MDAKSADFCVRIQSIGLIGVLDIVRSCKAQYILYNVDRN